MEQLLHQSGDCCGRLDDTDLLSILPFFKISIYAEADKKSKHDSLLQISVIRQPCFAFTKEASIASVRMPGKITFSSAIQEDGVQQHWQLLCYFFPIILPGNATAAQSSCDYHI